MGFLKLDTRYLITRLREQRGLLATHKTPSEKWRNQTREIMVIVLAQNPHLASEHEALWQQDTAEKEIYLAALDRLIRGLNRTDELQLSRNPVVIFTLLGILFMFLLAGGSYLYFALVISR